MILQDSRARRQSLRILECIANRPLICKKNLSDLRSIFMDKKNKYNELSKVKKVFFIEYIDKTFGCIVIDVEIGSQIFTIFDNDYIINLHSLNTLNGMITFSNVLIDDSSPQYHIYKGMPILPEAYPTDIIRKWENYICKKLYTHVIETKKVNRDATHLTAPELGLTFVHTSIKKNATFQINDISKFEKFTRKHPSILQTIHTELKNINTYLSIQSDPPKAIARLDSLRIFSCIDRYAHDAESFICAYQIYMPKNIASLIHGTECIYERKEKRNNK